MKKSITIIVLALIASLATAQTGLNQITQTFSMKDVEELTFAMIDESTMDGLDIVSVCFEVDKDLPAPKKTIEKYDDKEIAKKIVNISGVPQSLHRVVKTSFEGERLSYIADDNFYKCLVQAYADHHPLVLSPDIVWLIISQGVSRYVNAHTEEMRDLLVFHEGQMELVVNSNNDVLSPSGDWERLLNDFSTCIARNTKGELADLMTADFTTTGITERIASQVSLMDVVKKYFIYTNIAAGCGIPSITLEGTPKDWQKVLDKVRSLKKYHLEEWASDLEVILKEFVEASKGNANKKFWQNIVKKRRADQLKSEKGCLPSINSTYLDGWFLKFFPNALGETRDSVMWDVDMPQEMVSVGFRHVLTDPDTGEPLDTIPMQLWAGFVGIEEDAKTRALTPKIGWLARIADEESDEVARLKEQNKYMQLYFKIGKDQEVPHVLSKMDHIRSLRLDFWDNPIVIPEWLDNILIDKLSIMGQLTADEETQLRQRFPKAEIQRFEDIFNKLKLVPIEEESKETGPVKAGDKINGLMGDEAGPLFGATVCEIDAKGRIVESAITDVHGAFTMKVRNPEDRIRFSYVGMKTITVPITAKKYEIIMEPAERSQYRYIPINERKSKSLPIPEREVSGEISIKSLEGFTMVGDKVVSNENNPRITIPMSDEEKALVMPVNDLGFKMFRKVGAKDNILLSPMGMTYALGLISNGAGGETKKQINKVLGYDDKKAAKINEFCHKILTEAPKLDRLTQIEISNDFFSQKGYTPKSAFAKIATDYYHTDLKTLESDRDKGFVLVNTINFKGIWTDKFYSSNTEDEVFRDEDGKETTVPMMNQKREFFYTENDLCQTLCLPYGNGTYQMIIMLPKEGKTVSEVAQSLTADGWEKSYDQLRRVHVEVKLPRFESSSDVVLTDVMKALGMPNAFSKKANFSNLFNMASYIDMIRQKGHIEVDETGTVASIKTLLQGNLGGLPMTPPDIIRFHATRPFLYFIREWSTSAIFFIGQYMGT